MKKSSKYLALVGITAIAIGISSLFQPINKINKDIEMQTIEAYNHSTENALDNAFMQDNKIILPFIFDNANQSSTLDIRSKFTRAGLSVKRISTGTTVGTGTQITVNESSNVYNVLIYGDVNGDGLINLIDAQRIILHYLNQSKLTGLYAMAANVSNNNDDINLIDAQRVVLFYLGNLDTGLVVNEPQASVIPSNPTDTEQPSTPSNPSGPSNPQKPTESDKDKDEDKDKVEIASYNIILQKRKYKIDEPLDLSDGTIQVTYKGVDEPETFNIKDVMVGEPTGYDNTKVGTNNVTIICNIKGNSLTVKFDVEVVLGNITTIEVSGGKNLRRAICYREDAFELVSGVNEEKINPRYLRFIVQVKENGDLKTLSEGNIKDYIEIEIVEDKAEDVIGTKVKFTAKYELGYIITPILVDAETGDDVVTGTPIKICIKPDKSINKITLDTTTFMQDTETRVEIEFYHEYKDKNGNVLRSIKVKGPDFSEITEISTSIAQLVDTVAINEVAEVEEKLFDIQLLNTDGYELPDTADGDTTVGSALIKPNKKGDFKLSITVDSVFKGETYTHTEYIDISVNPIKITIDSEKTIKLYKTFESANGDPMVVRPEKQNYNYTQQKYIYTLIPIYKNENKDDKFKVKDICQLGYKDTGKINIIDNVYDYAIKNDRLKDIMECIDVRPFNEDGDIIYSPTTEDKTYANSEVYYIGIALRLGDYEDYKKEIPPEVELALSSIIISYGNNIGEPLTITIVD